MGSKVQDQTGDDAPALVLDHDVRVRLQKAELLLSISRTLAAFDTLDEMLSRLVEITTEEVKADRGTIFLNDEATGELYSRVAQGTLTRKIRFLNSTGIAGLVFTSGEGMIVNDAYSNEHFNPEVDKKTGYKTRSILCAPIRTAKGKVIGAAQALNKEGGDFDEEDLSILCDMTTQAAVVLQSAQFIEEMDKRRQQEMEFVGVVSDITSEIDLGTLLQRVMSEATRMLSAERSTLFLNDEKSNELFSQVGEGLGAIEIRFPNFVGIAGTVFTSGETVNIPHAYADLRFNPAFDKKTGYFTRSILCTPVISKDGRIIGVTQALNKRGGPFTDEDESRLRAFTAQVAIALENAKLFDDVQNMKNYNESILESMSNAVVTCNDEGRIITCNAAGYRLMGVGAEEILERHAEEFFAGPNAWVCERIKKVEETQSSDITMDADLEFGGERVSVNLTVLALTNVEGRRLGTMLMMEDISGEKRLKSTMSRYMDPAVADQLLESQDDILGGKLMDATVLFSDIRSFTPLTEALGAQKTVALLNEYFTIMVECIMREGGMLDKFIGDAIMAAFGIPVPHDDDADRAVRAAIAMLTELRAWNRTRAENGQPPVDIGVGVNTGMIISGNIGSPKRMDYTLIGDGVNLAARLETACKQYHTKILVSDDTRKRLHGTYRMREVDRVLVVGKTEPVAVHEILDFHDGDSFPNLMDVVSHFAEGLNHYRRANWDAADRAFREALRAHPGDELSQLYVERCELLKRSPPGTDWDGVWRLTSK